MNLFGSIQQKFFLVFFCVLVIFLALINSSDQFIPILL